MALLRTDYFAPAIVAGSVAWATPALAYNGFIGEHTDYSQCGGTNVNAVTATLKSQLDSDNNPTLRYVNASSWPHDYIESCDPPGPPQYGNGDGLDHSYGDRRSFTVFAGHGFFGELDFGTPHSGMCNVDMGGMMRLGQMNSGLNTGGTEKSGLAWWLTSCTMNLSNLASDANYQWVNQQSGFHNSSQLTSQMVWDTYFWSTVWNNAGTWLLFMTDYGNSTMTVSYGYTANSAQVVETYASARSGYFVWNGRGSGPSCGNEPPPFYYRIAFVNQGGC